MNAHSQYLVKTFKLGQSQGLKRETQVVPVCLLTRVTVGKVQPEGDVKSTGPAQDINDEVL